MKAVILCGGRGTRIGSHLNEVPKVLFEIGGRPIVWHVMKGLRAAGVREFVLCLGFRAGAVLEYFGASHSRNGSVAHVKDTVEDWSIILLNTGESTNTGGRIFQAGPHLTEEAFIATYGDGLAPIDVASLVAYHKSHGRLATVTAVRPYSQFGVMTIADDGKVKRFREKPPLRSWINGGFFVFDRRVLRNLSDDPVLESGALRCLSQSGQLMAYRHTGFWACMDTYKDLQNLNELWDRGGAKWKTWR